MAPGTASRRPAVSQGRGKKPSHSIAPPPRKPLPALPLFGERHQAQARLHHQLLPRRRLPASFGQFVSTGVLSIHAHQSAFAARIQCLLRLAGTPAVGCCPSSTQCWTSAIWYCTWRRTIRLPFFHHRL